MSIEERQFMAPPPQSKAVESLLSGLDADADRIRRAMIEAVAPAGSAVFPLDLFAFAASKRHSSTTSAVVAMVRAWNMVVARALLRMHIDTSLRFSAAWHVDDPHVFATAVLRGEQINKMKTRAGRPLTDKHLVELHADKYPWLPAVYRNLSGYVHLSGAHIVDAVEGLGDEGRSLQFLISDQDLKFPESSWVEVLKCFREATAMLGTFLHGWGVTKRLSEAQCAALRGGA